MFLGNLIPEAIDHKQACSLSESKVGRGNLLQTHLHDVALKGVKSQVSQAMEKAEEKTTVAFEQGQNLSACMRCLQFSGYFQ